MPEAYRDDVGVDTDVDVLDHDPELDEDDQWRRVHSDDVRAGRRYRPGRGGFDPEAAELAARTKYVRRQRIVLAALTAAIVTAILAAWVWTPAWWVHGIVDLGLVGYLTYLRRQVRIEEDVRHRRLARLNGDWDVQDDGFEDEIADESADVEAYAEDYTEYEDDRDDQRPRHQPHVSRAVAVELDDEDPMFDELDERTWAPYRRASGE